MATEKQTRLQDLTVDDIRAFTDAELERRMAEHGSTVQALRDELATAQAEKTDALYNRQDREKYTRWKRREDSIPGELDQLSVVGADLVAEQYTRRKAALEKRLPALKARRDALRADYQAAEAEYFQLGHELEATEQGLDAALRNSFGYRSRVIAGGN